MPNTYDPNDNDLTSRRKNNTRSTRSSKSNVSSDTDDLVKDLDLTSRKIEKVMKQKVEGEKKVTAEKKKQNEEDKKQSNYQNQQVNMLKNFQKTQSKIVQTQYDQTKILNQINKLMSQSNESEKESLKAQKEALKEQKDKVSLMQDYYDKLNKNYEEQKSYEKQISDMAKTHADMRSKELKNLQSHQIGLWRQQQKNLKDQKEIQDAINSGYMKSTDEIKRRFTELKDVQEDIAKQQEETARKIEQAKSLQSKRESLKTDVLNKLGANTDSDIFKYLSNRNRTGVSAEQKSFMKASAKLEAASTTIDTVFTSLGTLFTNWLNRFEQGINRIYNVYEDTYTKVSAITDVNQKQYQDWQNETVAVLKQQGLDNNVAISSVMTEMSNIVDRGITNFSDASSYAINSAIIKQIVPYLDTQSDAYITLSQQLGPKFQKTVAGIGKSVSEQLGQNRFISKNLDVMIDDMQYMTLAARKSLMSENEQLMLESLMKETGMTGEQAMNFYTDISDLMTNRLEALESGNLAQQMAAVSSETTFGGLAKAYSEGLELGRGFDTTTASGQLTFDALRNTMGINDVVGYNTDISKIIETIDKYSGPSSYGNSGEESFNKLLEEFSQNDKYTTATAQKDIYAENVSTSVATFKEQYPDAYDMIHSIVGTLGNILTTLAWGFAANGVTNLVGGIGKGGTGLVSKAGTAIKSGASKIGSAFSTAGGGTALGTAATVGGVAAGGAMAVKGGMDVYNDFKNDDVSWKTGASAVGAVGGAAGAGALLALGASNPVGWVALAIGGVALGARALCEAMDDTVNIEDDLNAQMEENVKSLKDSNKQQTDNMKDIRDQIKNAASYEDAKNIAIQSGIISQEDLTSATDKSVESLLKIADLKIEEQEDLNKISEDVYSQFENLRKEEKKSAGESILNTMYEAQAGGKSYKDLSDEEKSKMNQFMQAYISYAKESGLYESNKDVKWRIDSWGNAFDDDTFSKDDFKKIFNGDNKTTRGLFESFVSRDDSVSYLKDKDIFKNMYSSYSDMTLDADTIKNYSQSALLAEDIDEAKDYLKALKRNNYSWDQLPDSFKNELKEKFGDNISSYRSGSNYISADQIAQLHKGEAVLTKATTADLKETLGTNDIKNWSSQSLTDNISNGFGSISSVIVSQTEALVAKMNEIISAIINKNNPVQSVSRTTVAQRDITSLSLS